ncbi:MAG: hypothetical protein Q8N99_08935 [Nanoarchaeota archaeon]|nr:hypothetical protein [Nanoarchaeota archaeon]
MRLFKPADNVIFADVRIEKDFNSLKEDDWIKKAIFRAIADFKENAFCGERIKKEKIPKVYIQKYGIDNLLWYPLPDGWRLVYSVFSDDNVLIAMIVEYFDHKNYERRFGY